MSGQLIIQCVAAKNLYDAGDLIGAQDPYLKLTLGSTKLKSSVHKNGGTQARWNDTLKFPVPANSTQAPVTMHIACWDKDTISSDDLIGEASVNLPQLLSAGPFDGWIDLTREGGKQSAGQVHLQIRYEQGGMIAAAAEGSSVPSTNSAAAAAAAVVGGGAVAAVIAHKMDKKKRKKKKSKVHGVYSADGEEDCGGSSGSEWEGGDDGGDEEGVAGGLIGGIFGAIFGDD